MDRHYLQIAVLCVTSALANGETPKTVRSDATDRAILKIVAMSVVPRGAQLDRLIRNFMNEHPDKEIIRLAIYASEDDARDTEARKIGEMTEALWRDGFLHSQKMALPAAEFVRIRKRAVVREYDGVKPITRSMDGFERLAELTCQGASVRFLHLGMARYTPAMRLSVDTFFMYEGRFAVESAVCLAHELGIGSLALGSANIASDPAFPLSDDYPYFNRFIDSELYSIPENVPSRPKPEYFCIQLASNVKLHCGEVKFSEYGSGDAPQQ